MKLGPVTKLDKGNTSMSKKLDDTSCRQIVTPLSIFQFIVNLQPCGSRIPDGWSIKLIFSLIVTFILQNAKTKLKNLGHSPYSVALSKDTIFAKKC